MDVIRKKFPLSIGPVSINIFQYLSLPCKGDWSGYLAVHMAKHTGQGQAAIFVSVGGPYMSNIYIYAWETNPDQLFFY